MEGGGGAWRGWGSGGAPGGGAGDMGDSLMEGPGWGRDPGGMRGHRRWDSFGGRVPECTGAVGRNWGLGRL